MRRGSSGRAVLDPRGCNFFALLEVFLCSRDTKLPGLLGAHSDHPAVVQPCRPLFTHRPEVEVLSCSPAPTRAPRSQHVSSLLPPASGSGSCSAFDESLWSSTGANRLRQRLGVALPSHSSLLCYSLCFPPASSDPSSSSSPTPPSPNKVLGSSRL